MGHRSQDRTATAVIAVATAGAVAVAALIAVLGAVAAAKPTRHVRTVPLLSLSRGGFEVSLGDAPEWLPLSGTPLTLTLLAGAPPRAVDAHANAYVGLVPTGAGCAATPADSPTPYTTMAHFFSSAHSGTHAGMFAPDGGGSPRSYIESAGDVVVRERSSARACIWVAADIGKTRTVKTGHKHKRIKRVKAPRSLVKSLVVPLLNRTFAASVSNLSGATPGTGGFSMDAIDGGHGFRYTASTLQCGRLSRDGAAAIAAGTPASESISISASPCSTDASTFTFRGSDVNAGLHFPIADASTSPALTLRLGGCELDPLTGATLAAAEQYLSADGCKLGQIEVSPYEKTEARGSVAWAAVSGGVAELAPVGTTVDLVLNGSPA